MNTFVSLSAMCVLFGTGLPTVGLRAQTAASDTAAVQAKIQAENASVGKAIASRDFVTLNKYWSPAMIVNSPANQIVGRDQVIESMHHGGLNYTSLKGSPEYFGVSKNVAIQMGHDDVVMANGPMAGKHLVRRTTDILTRVGEDWQLIARQATYVGFDGSILRGTVTTSYVPQAPTPATAAIRAQIDANARALGQALFTKEFATVEKLTSPALVVNSPGNSVLTREQVFAAAREDKLKYSSYKLSQEAFSVFGDVAIEMGHEDLAMSNGPMAGQALTRRFTDVWQKTGDAWLLIARQATYVGVDGGAVYGHPDPTLKL
jgi:ketosteroid isomerase-like protein